MFFSEINLKCDKDQILFCDWLILTGMALLYSEIYKWMKKWFMNILNEYCQSLRFVLISLWAFEGATSLFLF